MINMQDDLIYNLDYIVIVPSAERSVFDGLEFSFGNIISFDGSIESTELLIGFLKKNTVKQLVFVDYCDVYEEIINSSNEERVIKFIFTHFLGELSDKTINGSHERIVGLYERGVVDEIGYLDPYLMRTMRKKGVKAKHILLDVPVFPGQNYENNGVIGILNSGESNYDSFYNELCSISLMNGYCAKLSRKTGEVNDFVNIYSLKCNVEPDLFMLMSGNCCNMCVNFSGTQPTTFLESMDIGVPCIIGNNSFLQGYEILTDYLMVKSDDNINEFVEKIKSVPDNIGIIMKEYSTFRKNYSKESLKSVEKFLIGVKIGHNSQKTYEKKLSVVVPVYNTEKYLDRCLRSIYRAKVPDMEVLIIDDGSTDNSSSIAKKYVDNYPELFRYIYKTNGGLGSVRNVGLKEAKGKYLASVDSDDSIDREFFKEALPYMDKNVDIIICDWMSVGVDNSFETPAIDPVFKNEKAFAGIMYTTIMPSTCNKIIKSELFEDNEIVYLEGKYEDLSANVFALLRAKTIKYFNKPYYNYYLRENSLMRSKVNPREMADVITYVWNKLNKMDINLDRGAFYYYTFSWRIEELVLNPLYDLDIDLKKEVSYIEKNMYDIIVNVFNNEFYVTMLDKLHSDKMAGFIRKRNAAFIKKRLENFIKETREKYKLTPGIIYYGD